MPPSPSTYDADEATGWSSRESCTIGATFRIVRVRITKLAGMLYGIYGSAFRFRRPSAVQHHEIPNNVWEVTRPEDHEEVCARTKVPPSGKKPQRVPAGKTECRTLQRTSRTPLTPDLHHHPIHVDLRWPAHTPTGEGRPALSPGRTAREHSPPCQGMHAAEDEETNSPDGLPLES